MIAGDVAAVEKSLRRRFRVVETIVPVASRELSIIHPASAEDLIDERAFERDERLPYWAELWPSSRVLGERLLAIDGTHRSLIELGCGAGVVSTCAALAGFDVVVSDYYEDALRFARVNAARNAAPVPRHLLLDWRYLPPGLPRFDVVIASDVLYERPYGRLVAQAIAATLAPGGVALVADPGRVGREEFMRALGGSGLEPRSSVDAPFVAGPIRQTITVLEIAAQR
ncbi:MAG: class I SAM-dependent methyltransferase [Gemmatimonadaceae bacterium]